MDERKLKEIMIWRREMSKEKAIKVLEDLRDYLNENWDESEYRKDLDEAEEAINIAVSALKESTFSGYLEIEGKKYNVSKIV